MATAVSLVILQSPASAQPTDTAKVPAVKSFEIVNREAARAATEVIPLYSYDGLACGTIAPKLTDSTSQYEITLDGKAPVMVNALSNVACNESADRILVYGDLFYRHEVAHAYLHIYTASGQLVKDVGLVALFPFEVKMDKEGNICIVGNQSEQNPAIFLKKFDKNGNLLWTKNLPKLFPNALSISEDGNRIGLALSEDKRGVTTVLSMDKNGQTIGEVGGLSRVSHINYAGGDNLIIGTGRIVYFYEKNGKQVKNTVLLAGNPIGMHPFTVSPDGNSVLITSIKDPETSSGFRLQRYELNGTLTHEATFDGEAFGDSPRLSTFESQETLKFMLPHSSFTLKMKN